MPINPNKIDYSGGLPPQLNSFCVIEDPRTGGNKKHHFGEILFMSVTAMLCGMNGFAEIEDFCELEIDWFKKWITLPNGIPRAQSFSNIFQIIDPDLFTRCLIDHLAQMSPALRSQIIAVDGKSLRGSHELGKGPDHAVSAWAADAGVTLGQEFVSEKSNEIKAIPRLLKTLNLKEHLVTIDAMGTQTEIAQIILDQQGDYLLALKGNQGSLHKEVIDHFEIALRHVDLKKSKDWTDLTEPDRSHGRDTTRTVLCTTNLVAMDPEIRNRWPGLKSLIVIENQTRIIKTGKERRVERRYYISSRAGTAEQFQRAIRLHWSIENQCHWVLDTVFREDHNQTRKGHAAKNLGSLRRIVLNILKDDPGVKGSLAKKRRHAFKNEAYRERLLSLA